MEEWQCNRIERTDKSRSASQLWSSQRAEGGDLGQHEKNKGLRGLYEAEKPV